MQFLLLSIVIINQKYLRLMHILLSSFFPLSFFSWLNYFIDMTANNLMNVKQVIDNEK
jgi:hypothetical protein